MPHSTDAAPTTDALVKRIMTAKRKSIVLAGTQFNYSITPEQMASAIAKVEKYSIAEKVRRFDDVFAAQPAILGAAGQLPSLGVDLELADHAFHVLLVLFECFSTYVPKLPKIGAETVQKAFDDLASMLRFYDGESPEEACRLQMVWAKEHQEHAVLAFVINYLNTKLGGASREQELVRNCCLAITNAYLAAYKKMQ
jgi:hypothetical protein